MAPCKIVTLGWIQGHPSKWKTYVANRVAEIQRLIPEAHWGHLPGRSNPADCASRGLLPGEMVDHQLWWSGPPFLRNVTPERPISPPAECLAEQRVLASTTMTTTAIEEHSLLKRYSTLHKLLRVTAWCLRWMPRIRHKRPTSVTDPTRRDCPFLSAFEMDEAEKVWIRWVQAAHYKREIKLISSNSTIPKNSILISLHPFIDEEGILRVGGRIRHSPLSLDRKHPIILPAKSEFSRLLVESHHRASLHGGTQLTLGMVRQRFWIPHGRSLVKQCIHRCVTCVRWRAASSDQLMADLPRSRVNPARPFQIAGVDYAGPIYVRTSPGRGHKTAKAFLAIFVCLVIKAVHLDVASSYSAEAFIATFRRFVSRRGVCSELYSDCGTNFVGADAELRRLFAASSKEGRSIAEEMANNRVMWRFNPPAAPHFGGLWKAAVKSTKHHLRRVIGDHMLTYEEMVTLLSQIEACLNSRPLSALTDDPEDLSALTPGHLLIGAPLTALPEPSLGEVPAARLSRWELIQQMRDHFWARWSQEYLQGLIIRPKWRKATTQYSPGQLCLLTHENTPPSRWPLARITKVHPGDDGLVRVVTVRTATSELKRPIAKLVLLPIGSGNAHDTS
ncbi:hypothetical protein RF55_18660 [Lasius niger]|uniref:Integrase catalytic domain-containing protein n=1 Tax=Lasius niger TaxID=67767 RepID=A0A0J7K0M3_LASNI|nr:hypothetical protein RF55_18660 [Lasius niger]